MVDAAASESKGRRVTVSRIGIGHSQGGRRVGDGRCNGYTAKTGWRSAERGGEGMEADKRAAGAVQVLSRLERGHDVARGDEHKHRVLVMGDGEWIGWRAVVIG